MKVKQSTLILVNEAAQIARVSFMRRLGKRMLCSLRRFLGSSQSLAVCQDGSLGVHHVYLPLSTDNTRYVS